MADSFTDTGALSSDTTAFEAVSYFALRPQLFFDALADVKPTAQTHRGSAVTFTIYDDLAAQTSALSETADPDAIAASDNTVTVTLVEQGAVIKTTQKVRATSYLDVDSDIANILGFNAGISLDTLARDVLEAGDNVRFATGGATTPTSRATIDADDTLSAHDVRRAHADLEGANVMPVNGTLYWAYAHPDVLLDLREETGAAAWRDPHVHSAPENIWAGEFGSFEGFKFISTPRAPVFTDGGSGTVDAYATLIMSMKGVVKPLLNNGNAETPTRGKQHL